jgi:hypothetical protein
VDDRFQDVVPVFGVPHPIEVDRHGTAFRKDGVVRVFHGEIVCPDGLKRDADVGAR